MKDLRTTQEIFSDLFGGLASLGGRGIDALILARAVAKLLIQKGLLTEDELVDMMREIAMHELEKSEDSEFVLESYREIVDRLNADKTRRQE